MLRTTRSFTIYQNLFRTKLGVLGINAVNLTEILSEECISLKLAVQAKPDIIRDMAELASRSGRIESTDQLVEALLAREQIQTTGIGHGMAIPHATAEGVKGLVLALGIAKEGVDFHSLDQQPVHLIFLLAGEPRLQTSFLGILSRISRFFRNEEFRNKVLSVANAKEILALIGAREEL